MPALLVVSRPTAASPADVTAGDYFHFTFVKSVYGFLFDNILTLVLIMFTMSLVAIAIMLETKIEYRKKGWM